MVKKVFIVILVGIPTILFGIVFWMSNFVFDTENICGEELLHEAYSSETKYKALVLERNCGATTGFSTLVSIQFSDSDYKKDIFLGDDDHGATPHGRGRSTRVEAEWISKDSLAIYHHEKARVFLSKKKGENLTIIYRNF